MKNQISFRTTLFDSDASIPPVADDQHFGEDLARWLSKKATGSEFEFGKPVQELHGWSETVGVKGESFLLGFGIADGYVGLEYAEWCITINHPRRWKFFGSKDSPTRSRLCDLIHNILRDEGEIRELQWGE